MQILCRFINKFSILTIQLLCVRRGQHYKSNKKLIEAGLKKTVNVPAIVRDKIEEKQKRNQVFKRLAERNLTATVTVKHEATE